ncbi:hypothetical protein B0J14DRAFT_663738 [Halenospora varia]|nr:hypothetical protein B0J14DRAFT_663738 [Halenospora varia]
MEKVRQAIDDVERKLGKINAITAKGASKMTVKDVVKLARKGNSINSTIKKGLKEYKDVEPTEQEAREILVQMRHIVEMEEKQMAFAIENKPTFDKLHCSGIVKKNLTRSEESAKALALVMVDKSPPSIRVEAEELDKRAKKSFNETMAVYSNATGGEDQMDDKIDDSD